MKIAVCFSGETRVWNNGNIQESWYKFKNLVEQESPDNEVTFYGHTWSHCEEPIPYVDFANISITDQKEIDDFVLENIIYRAVNKESWLDKIKFNNLSSEDLIDHYLSMSRRGYGQLVSGVKSFQLVPEDYDPIVYIRTRWDVELYEDWVEYFINIIKDIQSNNWPYTHENEDIYLMNTTVVRFEYHSPITSPEDFLYIIRNRQKARDLIYQDIYEVIDDYISNTNNDKSTPTSHNIWNKWFSHGSFTALPMIDNRCAKIYRHEEKENIWDI